MFTENLLKNPIIEGYESIKFKTHGLVVAYTNQYGMVGSVYSADLAEAFKYDPNFVKELPEEGTVMVFNEDNGLVVPSHDTIKTYLYAGVVRYKPGMFLGGDSDWDKLFNKGFLPLALIGQVPVRVHRNFNYQTGTKLVSYIDGYAKPLESNREEWFGKVIRIIDQERVLALIK